jgi:hypothetical protein
VIERGAGRSVGVLSGSGTVVGMALGAEDLWREALALPEVTRAHLAADLLASLEGPLADDPTVVRAVWTEEIDRRARRVSAGDVDTEDWSTVRLRLADELAG